MPRFNSPRDVRFFRQISTEMVDDVIETPVVIYKLNVGETSYNLYGESLSKQYYKGFQTFCVIQREDTATNYDGFGSDTARNSTFRFNRHTLETADFYPEVGDLVYLNDVYYEISNVREDQWVGGLDYNKFSVICEGFMTRKSAVDLDETIR